MFLLFAVVVPNGCFLKPVNLRGFRRDEKAVQDGVGEFSQFTPGRPFFGRSPNEGPFLAGFMRVCIRQAVERRQKKKKAKAILTRLEQDLQAFVYRRMVMAV